MTRVTAAISLKDADSPEAPDAPPPDADASQPDAQEPVDSRLPGRAAPLQQLLRAPQAVQDLAGDDQQHAAQQPVVASQTFHGGGSRFANRSVVQQQEPPQATPDAGPNQPSLPTPEVAGAQTIGMRRDRTSVDLQVLPDPNQGLPATADMIPSTGGPSAAFLAVGLALLGDIGLCLRRVGTRRS